MQRRIATTFCSELETELPFENRRLHTQNLVQFGRCGGVLEHHLFVGEDDRCRAESCQRALVKTAQNQLLLAGVGVDVADRKDAGQAGGKLFGIDLELPALNVQAPVGNRPDRKSVV